MLNKLEIIMSKSKITQIKTTSGPIHKKEKTQEELNKPSAMTTVWEDWKEELQNWKGIPWGQTRADLVGEFVRAVCFDLIDDYDDDAASKVSQVMGNVLVLNNKEELHLNARSLMYQTHIDLTWKLEEDTPSSREDATELTLMLEEDSTEKDALDALKNIGDEPQTRLVFDPITQLEDEEIRHLMSVVEKNLDTQDDSFLLMAAASVLINWQKMEKMNATSLEYVAHGLTDKGQPIAVGKKMVVKGHTKIFDESLKSEPDNLVIEAQVSFPKPKLH